MTITGKILLATGSGRNTRVRFVPLSNPQSHTLGMLMAGAIDTHTDADGNLPAGLVLKTGEYAVAVGYGKRDVFNIAVEDSDVSVDIKRLSIIPDSMTEVYRPQFWLPNSGTNYEFTSDYLMLRNRTSGLYNPIAITSATGLTVVLADAVAPLLPNDIASRIGTYYRQSTNGDFQLLDTDTGNWYPIVLAGADDASTHWNIDSVGCDELEDTGYMPYAGRNFRDRNHELEFYNTERKLWQAVYTEGLGGAVHFVFRAA